MIAAALYCTWCLLARFMHTLAMAPPCGPVDCADLKQCWGLHTPNRLNLRCDNNLAGGGWTILQQRRNEHVNFYRKWAEYKRGFGTGDTFWLGLDNLYRLTRKNTETTLRVELTFGRYRSTLWAEYYGVTFGNEAAFYALKYSLYNRRSRLENGLLHHTGPFCCSDSPASDPCRRFAMYGRTGWWFSQSRHFGSDLNAVLHARVQRQSVYWVGVQDISFTQIKFRPSRFGLVADCDKSCPNGGTCLGAANGTFHCRCALGYTGRRCESTTMPALQCFCFHDGTCLADGSCSCPAGYTGSMCNVKITSDVTATPSPGSGVVPPNGTSYYGVFAAVCDKSCPNGGTCVAANGTFHCRCALGYTGRRCESTNMPALPCLCFHDGTCLADGSCSCPAGYTGSKCNVKITSGVTAMPSSGSGVVPPNGTSYYGVFAAVCDKSCPNGGTCVAANGTFHCRCALGYTGRRCESTNMPASPCLCFHDGTCLADGSCSCPAGYTGSKCNVKITSGVTATPSSGSGVVPPNGTSYYGVFAAVCDKSCPNGGTCVAANGTFHCRCALGYTGRRCESTNMPALPCLCFHDGTCLADGSCSCPAGYTGSKCNVKITSGVTATPSPGSGVVPPNGTSYYGVFAAVCDKSCPNGGTCVAANGTFHCRCALGYTGRRCESTNMPALPCLCFHDGTCLADGSCSCPAGYTGSKCNVKITSGVTATPSPGSGVVPPNGTSYYGVFAAVCDKSCPNGGTCVAANGTFHCRCALGYTGRRCESTNMPALPCLCFHDGTCLADGSCSCPAGYTGSKCNVKITSGVTAKPSPGSGVVPPNGTSYYGVFAAVCDKSCPNGGTCVAANGTFHCRCALGYTGRRCESTNMPALPCLCFHDGTCLADGSCSCPAGYTGSKCNVKITSDVTATPSPGSGVVPPNGTSYYGVFAAVCDKSCPNGGTCVAANGTFHCRCALGYTGRRCESTNMPALPCLCFHDGTCLADGSCSCPAGYTGSKCNVKITSGVTAKPSPGSGVVPPNGTSYYGVFAAVCDKSCPNGGTCVAANGTFHCRCALGYTGRRCESTNMPALPCLCFHDGTCLADGSCSCPAGYTGSKCNVKITSGVTAKPSPGSGVVPPNGTSYYGVFAAVCDKSCPNGGTCVAANGTFHCRCALGYTGRRCESTNMPALPCLCFHDGTCLADGSCSCPAGYTGSKCNVKITSDVTATPSPGSGVVPPNGTSYYGVFAAVCDKSCPNGGTCVAANGTFHCRCALGYKGRRCEMSDSSYVPAVPCYCFKGGTCLVDGSCLCPLGYTGSKCNVKITSDVTATPSPGSGVVPPNGTSYYGVFAAVCDKSCPNGGTCVAANGTFHCRCALGYKGRRCEMSDSSYVPAVPCYCFKGGTCLVDGSCLCPLGYTGSKCHEKITSYVATSPGSGVVATSPGSAVVATSPGSAVVATSPGSGVVPRNSTLGEPDYRWVRLEMTCRC